MIGNSLFRVASLGVAAATALSLADGGLWASDLVANLRLHLLIACLLLVGYWLLERRRAMAALMVMSLLVNAALTYRALMPLSAPTSDDGAVLRVATINVRQSNDDVERVQKYLVDQSVDIVIVQEISARWLEALSALENEYPYQLAEPRVGNFGIAMLSKRAPSHQAVRHFTAGGIPYIEVTVPVGDVPVTIIGVHLSWPVMPGSFRARNAQILELSEREFDQSERLVLCGDLNLSIWSDWFDRLLAEGHFADVDPQVAVATTWPSFLPWGGLSIDHCLARPGVAVSAREVGPSIGSDHLPTAFELTIGPAD
ncbi:MAG: endonuclease/exonuclease/phosphatase family protein [Pseudomonadota bacterium]